MAVYVNTRPDLDAEVRTLPARCYTDPEHFGRELEAIHYDMWLAAGRTEQIPTAGSYFLRQVGRASVIVVRDADGGVSAFHNVCRHRGTLLCTQAEGRFAGRIQCPYHAWTYGLDGRLVGAPHMQEEGFDKREHSLHPASLAEWEGFLFVNIAREPQPFDAQWAPMRGRLARFGLEGLRVGHRVTYDVHANWKLVFENYSECLHCPTIHPKLATVLPYQSGANDLIEGPFLGGYMEIKAPNQSATMSGKACGRLVNDTVPEEDRHRGYYYTLMPNLLLSLHPDYVNYYLVHPVSIDHTVVESEWLFHPETVADPGSNIRDAIEFWDLTNRQDWDIVEQSQLGIGSRRYQPGPYSPRESIPAAWDREYLRWMGRG